MSVTSVRVARWGAVLCFAASFGGATARAQAPATLRIGGDVPRPLELSERDLRAMSHVSVRATDHGKAPAVYEGVPLVALLERAGVTFGAQLRGPRLATYVVVDAVDGYRVTFAVAELDSAFSGKQVLVVDRKDGAPLSAEEGPLRLVVPDEKRPARWARQVVGVRVLSAPPPQERP